MTRKWQCNELSGKKSIQCDRGNKKCCPAGFKAQSRIWGNIIKLGLDTKFSDTSAAFDVQGLVLLRFYPPELLHTALVKSEVYLETAADSWTDLSGHLELINERKTDVNTHTHDLNTS